LHLLEAIAAWAVLEIRPQRPLESQLKTQKWRIVSAMQNLLLQKGVWARGHSMHKGAGQSVLPYISDMTDTASSPGFVQIKRSQSS
jgi:hypothetical protein